MNILIGIVLAVAGFIALLLILALFTKKEYKIDREITINKPRQKVFDFVKHIKNQDYYNKWAMTDPNMKKDFKGSDGTVGFVYAWDGNKKAGKGEQEIKRITEGERIDMELRFIKPFEGIANAYMTTGPGLDVNNRHDQTKVRWVMEGKNPYPMNVMNLFMANMLGKDLDISLNNLKSILEKQ